jgi:hypothetical protein
MSAAPSDRLRRFLLPLVVSILMSFIVSGVSTLLNTGLRADLPLRWMQAWALSWVVAFPTLLVVLPFAARLVAAVTARR